MSGTSNIIIDSAVRACMLSGYVISMPDLAHHHVGFPREHQVIAAHPYGSSSWSRTARVVVRFRDGSAKAYFLRVSIHLFRYRLLVLVLNTSFSSPVYDCFFRRENPWGVHLHAKTSWHQSRCSAKTARMGQIFR